MDPQTPIPARSAWPLLAALLACILLSAYLLHGTHARNDGHLVYALDDAYIHMALAKHWVTDGVFGVTPHEFTFATSSPLWTLLLAGVYALSGVSHDAPLVLNLLCALAALVLVFTRLRRWVPSGGLQFAGLLLVLYLTPLVPMVFAGMEHCLHILLVLALFFTGAELLGRPAAGASRPVPPAASRPAPPAAAAAARAGKHESRDTEGGRRRDVAWLLVLAALAVMARYESLFIVGFLAVFFAFRRRWATAILLVVAGSLPVIVWGLVSAAQGGFWLPTSLMLKGHFPLWSSPVAVIRALGYTSIQRLTSQEPLLYTLAAGSVLALLYRSRCDSFRQPRALLPALVVVACLAHLQFAKTGWFYRYDAYLHALGVSALVVAFGDRRPRDFWKRLREAPGLRNAAVIALGVLILLPLHYRGKAALQETVPATGNIYEQQVQMGRFLRAYYNGASIAANDIGAINYHADLKCLDLWGLGTIAVARAKRAGSYSTAMIDSLARERETRIAIVYADWFGDPSLPESWRSAGRWTIRNPIVVGGETIEFFAVRQGEFRELVAHLQAFSDSLPPGVRESGYYREP